MELPQTEQTSSWDTYGSRVEGSTGKILDLCDKHGVRATFFVLGWVAERYPNLIKEIHRRGHDLGCHSMYHQPVGTLTPTLFARDLEQALSAIEEAAGVRVTKYRAPGFSITAKSAWALETMNDLGIKIDCSIFPRRHAHGGFPSFPFAEPCWIEFVTGKRILELPMSASSCFGLPVIAGGGYFRALPKFLLSRHINRHGYCMTYFHPRDFDVEQPVIPKLTLKRKFRTYIGVRGALAKLDYLMSKNRFISIEEFDLHSSGNQNSVKLALLSE